MKPPAISKKILRPLFLLLDFIRLESSSGVFLFIAAILALIMANSPLQDKYLQIVHATIAPQLGEITNHITLFTITNDLLMAIFFLLVGLEIKREIILGELNSLAKISLPAIAALGGMIVPALIYVAFNYNNSMALKGWGIPTATDIGFALGVMAFLGKRVPLSIKLFLMALAIFDDIGAIVIIAIFYQSEISLGALALAGVCLTMLWLFNRLRINHLGPYCLLGILLWFFLLKSGVHSTVAGVLLAFTIPIKNHHVSGNLTIPPLDRLMHGLHPWVAYGILPLFSFVNAGISFSGMAFRELFTPLSCGIILGLWVGKQLGIFGATWLAIRCGWAPMIKDANWRMIYGTALICGIGFTMSLFIGNLAFSGVDSNYQVLVRFGVFVGSLLSGISGYALIAWGSKRAPKPLYRLS